MNHLNFEPVMPGVKYQFEEQNLKIPHFEIHPGNNLIKNGKVPYYLKARGLIVRQISFKPTVMGLG